MIKKILMPFILVLFIGFSCSCSEKDTHSDLYSEVVEVFSAFDNKTEMAKEFYNSRISFFNHTLHVDKLYYKGELQKTLCSFDGKLYFYTTQKNGALNFSLYVYRCDYSGRDLTNVLYKEGFIGAPKCFYSDFCKEIIYVQSQERANRNYVIDSYEMATGKYENVCKGIACDEYIENTFGGNSRKEKIKNKLTEDVKFTEDMLSATEEGQTLLKYNLNLKKPRIAFLNGQIFVSYYKDIGSMLMVDVTFEYDETQNELHYYCYNIVDFNRQGVTDIYLY